jgi:hypothetical protein
LASAVKVDDGGVVGVGLSLEEQLVIKPANVMIPNNLQLIFHDCLVIILFIFLLQRCSKSLAGCYLNMNVSLLKAISILI